MIEGDTAPNAAPGVASRATVQPNPSEPKSSSASKLSARAKREPPSADRHGQFVNEGAYAKRGSPDADGRKASGREVIGEVLREDDRYVQHLIADGIRPMPPRVLAGRGPSQLIEAWERLVRLSRLVEEEKIYAGATRYSKQRSTATILGSTICSYPFAADEDDLNYVRWRELVVTWAKRRYGEHLLGIYEHALDEPKGHIHVLFANKGRNVKPLLAGPAAALKVMKGGGTKREAGMALKAANRELQDEFQREVGSAVGLGRIGPRPQPKKSLKRVRAEKRKVERQAEAAAALSVAGKLAEMIRDNESLCRQLISVRREKNQLQLALEKALARAAVADKLERCIDVARLTGKLNPSTVDVLLALTRDDDRPPDAGDVLSRSAVTTGTPGLPPRSSAFAGPDFE